MRFHIRISRKKVCLGEEIGRGEEEGKKAGEGRGRGGRYLPGIAIV